MGGMGGMRAISYRGMGGAERCVAGGEGRHVVGERREAGGLGRRLSGGAWEADERG